MKRDYDEVLKQALTPNVEPDFWLNQKILRQVREEKRVEKKKYKRIPAVVLTAALVLGVGSMTTVAAWKYLMPNEVAEKVRDEKLAEAFRSEDAVFVNETQSYGGYHVTFLGIVSGEALTEQIQVTNGSLRADQSHIVVAIENADGTPMPDTSEDAFGELEFLVSPFIKGYNPVDYNAFFFGGGHTDIVEDGVLYRIMECDNVEIFADQGLYLGVIDNTFYQREAYLYDEVTGEITRNEAYDGLNALFQLPIDVAKADPVAAKTYMETFFDENEDDWSDVEKTTEELEVEEWIAKLTPENIEELAVLVEHTVQVLTVDENGMLNVAPYEVEGRGGSGGCSISERWAFQDVGYGMTDQFGYSHSGTLDTLRIETFTKNEDGTYTFAVYIPR